MEFSNTRISLGRSIFSYGKVQYAISAIIRNKPIFARRKPSGSYLDVGCGPNIDAAFCNLDYMWRPGVDVCWDVTRGLPFPDKYFGGILPNTCWSTLRLKKPSNYSGNSGGFCAMAPSFASSSPTGSFICPGTLATKPVIRLKCRMLAIFMGNFLLRLR